jgi:hypothetical protein
MKYTRRNKVFTVWWLALYMSVQLSHDEQEVVIQLRDAGLPMASATLAVVLVTREHSRPEEELVDIVRQYPGLEDRSTTKSALDELRRRGWVREKSSYGIYLMQQAPDLRMKIAELTSQAISADRLSSIRVRHDPHVRIVGPVVDEFTYTNPA